MNTSEQTLFLKPPYPPRKATDMLYDRLVEHLRTERPSMGSPFFSESELIEACGLSRVTVRRALTRLSKEGWVERRVGKGTVVGPSVLTGTDVKTSRAGAKPLVRLAVLTYAMQDSMPDWYSREVLQGIDEMAGDLSLSIELVGNLAMNIASLSQRLEQSRPDVLAVMPSTTRHAFMVAEAQRLDIPCVLTGTRMLDLRLPTVCEDGAQGAAMAVRHLFEHGHRRIGLLQRPDTAMWVFERRQGYVQGLEACGLDHDERLVSWLGNALDSENVRGLAEYLRREKPTALLLSSSWHMPTLGSLVREGGLRIPQDVSVVTFDQNHREHMLHVGVSVTTIDQPLRAMGRSLAQMAWDIVNRRPVAPVLRLPCTLTEGASVMSLSTRARSGQDFGHPVTDSEKSRRSPSPRRTQ